MYKLLFIILLAVNIPNMQQKDINVKISLEKEKFMTNDEITLHFEVQNNSSKLIKFCEVQTPFEGFRGIFMRIIHLESGEELPYYGPMVKRMPPQPDEFKNLDKTSSAKCSLSLNKAYRFEKSGKYSIQFIGQSVNELPDSNILTLEIQ